MHRNKLAGIQRLAVEFCDDEVRPEIQLLWMCAEVCTMLEENPTVTRLGEDEIWVTYENSCFPCELLLEKLGAAMAEVSQAYKVSLYGDTPERECANITAEACGDRKSVEVKKYNVSGKDFGGLLGLGIRICTKTKAERELLFGLLNEVRYDKEYLVYPRDREIERIFKKDFQMKEKTYFRYVPLTVQKDMVHAIDSIGLERKKQLWLLLLEEDISAAEFTYVFEAYERRELPNLFSWDLSLRMAVSEAKVTIDYGNQGFRVMKNDERIRYSWEEKNAAKCLFLKILYPL